MDFGAVYDGYLSDMTRTICLGRATDEMKKVYNTVLEAQLAAIDAIKIGADMGEIDAVARKVIGDDKRGWTAAQWGLRWLYNQSEVTVVLSGMNSLDMVRENVATASDALAGSFTESDHALIERIRQEISAHEKVGCTGCRYCMPCPKGVDIPGIFRCWNTMNTESKGSGRHQYFQAVAMTKAPSFASQCIECGKCEKHCPQSLPIRQKLKEADRDLRPLHYKIALSVARKFMTRDARKKSS